MTSFRASFSVNADGFNEVLKTCAGDLLETLNCFVYEVQTIMKRFATFTESELLTKRKNAMPDSTICANEYAARNLRQFLTEKGTSAKFEEMETAEFFTIRR